jgi:Ca2+-binding EF-hand superfamily protein
MKKSGTQPQAPKKNSNWRAEDYVTQTANLTVVNEVKEAFDLFDTDQGGSIDTKGKKLIYRFRNQSCYGFSRFRI